VRRTVERTKENIESIMNNSDFSENIDMSSKSIGSYEEVMVDDPH